MDWLSVADVQQLFILVVITPLQDHLPFPVQPLPEGLVTRLLAQQLLPLVL
jgi:hypothetical protein